MDAEALFKTKAVKIDTLGEYLAKVRAQLNFDIKTVSILTQIKPLFIEELEAGNYQTLPAEVYIRGFLKSLANLYRIKEQILIDQYEKERGFETVQGLAKRERIHLSLTPGRIILAASVLVGLLALTYIGFEIRSVLAPPYLSLDEPSSDQTVDSNSIVVSGRAEAGAEVSINNQPVLTDSSGQFTETLLLGTGLNIVEIVEKNKFNKVSKITRQITNQTQVSAIAPKEALNLTIQTGPNSAWVYLEADGVVVQRGTMLAGSVKTISAKDEIILTSADAGSTQVIYNGKDLGKLGREGEVIRNVQFSSQ
ncbi:MAG: RodZ domain-containing protein [Candidatus Doudnabacteria bacterium]